MSKKTIDKIFITFIVLLAAIGYIKPIVRPHSIITQENRKANKLPVFSVESFLKGTYQDNYEKAYADQILFANSMKQRVKNSYIIEKITYYKLFGGGSYCNMGSGLYMVNDCLVYRQNTISDEVFDKKAENINSVNKKLKNIPMYVYYIERDLDINLDTNEKTNNYNKLISRLNSGIKTSKLEINNFDEYKNYYYRTDHHWNYRGVQKGYEEIIRMLYGDREKYIITDKEVCLNSIVNGSKSRTVGATAYMKEKFCTYVYKFPEHTTYVNGKESERYGQYGVLLKKPEKEISYASWYGPDKGLLEYDYDNIEKENLLIIGDSFDNAIGELLASHFNKTYIIDLRHYEEQIGQVFNIEEFCEEKDINKVLFIGSVTFYGYGEFFIEGVD